MKVLIGSVILMIALGAPIAQAQGIPYPSPTPANPSKPIEVAGLTVSGSLAASLSATSNVRLDPTEISDHRWQTDASVSLTKSGTKGMLMVYGDYTKRQAFDDKTESQLASGGGLQGQYHLNSQWTFTGVAESLESVIGKDNPNQFNGYLNGIAQEQTLSTTLKYDDDTFYLELETRAQEMDNFTQIRVTALREVMTQNRKEKNISTTYGRPTSWGKYYAIGGVQSINYIGNAIALPEDRDSDGWRYGLGTEFKHGKTSGVMRMFAFRQNFEANSIPTVDDVVGELQTNWQVASHWQISLLAERTFDETNIQGSGGIFTNAYGVGLLYQPQPKYYAKASVARQKYSIAASNLGADADSAEVSLGWNVAQGWSITFTATVLNQDVNDATLAELAYSDREAIVTATYTF
ncbi:MAG: outer membrane beta-barrel protein [Halieaceae bacterium]|nr:outer membrane beta-barrel protein [Halieaceae bacterium]